MNEDLAHIHTSVLDADLRTQPIDLNDPDGAFFVFGNEREDRLVAVTGGGYDEALMIGLYDNDGWDDCQPERLFDHTWLTSTWLEHVTAWLNEPDPARDAQ